MLIQIPCFHVLFWLSHILVLFILVYALAYAKLWHKYIINKQGYGLDWKGSWKRGKRKGHKKATVALHFGRIFTHEFYLHFIQAKIMVN